LTTGWRPFDWVATQVDRLTSAMNAIGTVWILALMLLINADVIGRGAFGEPIAGVPEMVALSIVGIVFLQLANTLRMGKLTRSDALLVVLRRRLPRLATAIDALFNLTGAVLVWVVVSSFWPKFIRSWEREEFVGAVGNFTAPVWPINLIVVIGATAMMITFLLNAICLGAAAWRGHPPERERERETPEAEL
jgi:TRAP-type mannitol/chloroaromatic compound transport system permease small subunit